MYYFPYTFLQGVYYVHICISDRMAENIKEEKVSIKEEMSTVEDTCIVYVQEENVKEECTDTQGSINCIIS